MVLCEFCLDVQETKYGYRDVWHFKEAKWHLMEVALKNTNWDSIFYGLGTNMMVEAFNKNIMDLVHKHITCKRKQLKASVHPWLNAKCRNLILLKQ